MKRKTKRYLSSILAVVMTTVFCFGSTAFTFVSAAETRKIDVWDLGGVAEADTNLYNNNIIPAMWNSTDKVSSTGAFVAGSDGTTSIAFGDMTLTYIATDRYYSGLATKNYGSSGFSKTAFSDGYTANGMYYCNGTGGETRRYFTIENVVAGDTVAVYVASSNAVTGTLYFKYTGTDATQKDSETYTNVGAKHTFVAKYSGTYTIYTDGSVGKPIYNRIVRIPGVKVSGTIDAGTTGISGYTLKFTNDTTKVDTEALLSGNSFTAALAPGFTYTATLVGATGFGLTNDTKVVAPSASEVISGKLGVVLKVEPKSVYEYTGSIAGFDASYDLSKLAVTLKAPAETLEADVPLKINADLTFSAILSPDVKYTAELSGVNDYTIASGGTVNSNQNYNANINVIKKDVYAVTGSFTGLPADKAVTEIKFTNVEDSYSYTGTVTGNTYSVSLRNGSYSATATVDGYRTSTHVVVNNAAASKDLLFVSTAVPSRTNARVADVYVGCTGKENNYATVTEAMKAIDTMIAPTVESERITVHIAPGTYREQIFVSTPYVSFVKEGTGDVLLTWYYGIGYKYYSADSTGYYNNENSYDEYSKNTVSKWGCSTYIKESATGFKSDNIIFEASFNRYITDEEIEDGVQLTGLEAITFARKYGADVTSKAATERAAAMAVEADKVEFTNCSFLGGQDTLYTGGKAYSSYYKNCFIEGNTDYIFGDGNVVFDGCNLSWKGYSDSSVINGYITAAKDIATKGYLFRNCTVTGNDSLNTSGGYFGRPWGKSARVLFMNTKLENAGMIIDAGWTDMSGASATTANFGEYNTTVADGTAEDVSKRVTGVKTAADVSAVKVSDYFGTWTPSGYVAEDAAVAFAKLPTVTDNGDINAPYPGHTLTANYSLGTANDANDASVIKWYRVNATTQEAVLVKASSVLADRTYKITADDQGSFIKVVVAPETLSGNKGEEKSYQVEAFVRTGFENPDASQSEVILGDGVNIFLAGDSTVKDYSAAGMYMSGKAQSEGSWGEYLQRFFDSSLVNVLNYANGGRSSRNFINEGKLNEISQKIGKGDYLFIQFGHNDCANSLGYIEDRYVPLGTPDANGIFPVTAGNKVETPLSMDKYGETYYSADCGGTYKWYLLQYIEAAKAAGATPVLVTPVSRVNYNTDGTIKPHHDSTDTTTGTYVSSNNAYVAAVKQLGQEQNVLVIDAFEMTKAMYEAAYKADPTATAGVSAYAKQVMSVGDGTHSNKLGGLISAAYMATAIQKLGFDISSAIQMPTQVIGETATGAQVFSVNGKSQLTAYAADSAGNFTLSAGYWQSLGQSLITAIGEYKAPVVVEADADYSAVTTAVAAANALTATDYKDFSAVTAAVAAVQYGLKISKQADVNAMAAAINSAVTALQKVEVVPSDKTIWVIGDSTVSAFNDAYYYPRYGWGTQLGSYLDGSFKIQNLALSGRSSKSYVLDAEYQTLLNGMKSGDYLFIGFGHNDEKAEDGRYTNPNGTYKDAGSFANSLYENYIKQAQAAGVTVVLCTPIVRRTATGEWSDSNLHVTSTTGTFAGGDYAKSIKDLGTELSIPVVDMTSLTKSLYDTLGAAETLNLHAWTSSKADSVDNTHTNIWGAKYNAYMIMKTVKELNVTGLASHVTVSAPPIKADTLIVNPNYKESTYSGVLADSALCKDFGIWKGTAFGDLGGNPSTANHILEADADGNMHLKVLGNKGKIAGTVDGLIMYYYKVPANSTFTLTATAKINSFDANDQVSFGLMARDEMYIDYNTKSLLGDYVAAGPLKLTKGAGGIWNCFARKSGVLTQGGTMTKNVVAGDVVNLSISGNSDGYACTYGDEATITGGFDFKLTSIDANYVYVGMFAARNADITYSNIKLVVDGVEVKATTTDPGTGGTTDPGTGGTTDPGTGGKTDPGTGGTTDPGTTVPAGNVTITAGNNETISSSVILDAVKAAGDSKEVVVDASKGSVSEISNDVFKAASEKNATVVIKADKYTWEFSGIPSDTTASLLSPIITIDAVIPAITDKLGTTAGVNTNNVLQLNFEHSGALPGTAKVTLNVGDKYLAGTVLYFYYFNTETGLFEKLAPCTVTSEGTVDVYMTHCSEYVLTSEELPQTITAVAAAGTTSATDSVVVQTGDKKPIVALFCLYIISGGAIFVARRKRKIA